MISRGEEYSVQQLKGWQDNLLKIYTMMFSRYLSGAFSSVSDKPDVKTLWGMLSGIRICKVIDWVALKDVKRLHLVS